MTHRYYDPNAGRFITRDPIGYDGGINLYAYTANNPVNDADPDGTFVAPPLVVIGPGAIITAGVLAGLDLATYKLGHPQGPFTRAGEGIGNLLFPPTMDMPPATCPQMSKGGKQRGGGDDPRYDKTCDQLEKDYEDAKSRRDSKSMLK